jgi:uncharacterized protein (TIGR03086 family)
VRDLEALATAGAELEPRLRALSPTSYRQPSVCAGWSAADLANHVVGGEQRYLLLLRDAEPAEVEATRGRDHIGDDPARAYAIRSRLLDDQFRQPGALQRTVRHRAGDRSGLELLRMRVMERALHAWDLARTLGLDDTLGPGVVDYLLGNCLPLVTDLQAKGLLGPAGPGGSPAQPPMERLLRLTGRQHS